MSSPLLELQDVSFTYPGGETVLEEVNLYINRSDLVVIKGESGVGKSTILKLLNRFCDYEEGTILFREKDLKDYRIEELRSSIIYLPQIPITIDGTIEENLSFPFRFGAHRNKVFDRKNARNWLDFFRLDLPFNRDALNLSIGQKQRVALIRAMILMPQVLLLDEPVASLDKRNRKIIEEKVQSLTLESHITVVMVTHGNVSSTFANCRHFQISNRKLRKMSSGDNIS